MIQKTAYYMKEQNMVSPGQKLVIGVSGGKDSVCLLHILKDLGFLLEAVHVNHGIRGEEAKRDEEFVEELCRRLEIPLHSYFYDVPAISKEQHLSHEEAGRIVRRRAFEEVLEKTGASAIALAHHGNDRAETFLFHLSRGTGMKGLSSMRPKEGAYVRPLLWAERGEIEAYVEKQNYEYVEDSTNQSVCYTRNKIRHQIMPVLSQVNEKSVAHICNVAEKLNVIADFVDREAQKLFEACTVCSEKSIRLKKDALYAGDEALYIPVFQKCVNRLAGSLTDLTEVHFQMVKNLLTMQTGKEICLPAGLIAARTYEGVRFFFREEIPLTEPVEITGEGTYLFGGKEFRVSLEDWNEWKNFPTNHYTKCFDYDKILGKIFLRTRLGGDFLEINQDHGTKSLQDYLVNEKVPKESRDQVILLAEESHILWVVGKRISEYYKVTRGTKKVLKIQMHGEEDEEFCS